MLCCILQVSGTSKEHGEQLAGLKSRLADFERALDQLEDWLLPRITRVEAKEFMTQDLPRIADEIQVRPSRAHRKSKQGLRNFKYA